MNSPLPSPFVRREVSIAGVRLTYIEGNADGSASKRPLLLLHGLIATAETLLSPLAALVSDRRVVALDILTASVESVGAPPDLSFAGLADLIVAFAAEIGMNEPVVLGHSHGGALALQIATSHTAVPSALILICPAHPFGGYDERLVKFYLTPWGRAFARILPLLPARLFDISRMTGPDFSLSKAQIDGYRAALRLPTTVPRTMLLLQTWQADMERLREALRSTSVEIPVLLLWGDSDPAVPVATAPILQRYLPLSERIILAGIGHLPADEAPAECVRLLRRWLVARDFDDVALAKVKARK